MDAHITADPPVETESVRLPEEAAEPCAADGVREEGSRSPVRLPEEAGEVRAEEDLEESSGAVAPEAGERLPSSPPTRRSRRQMLFGGVAAMVLGTAGTIVYLVSPYNHVYPVPQMASMVRHWAAEAGVAPPEPLAPAASLAGAPASPTEPVVREKYQPKKKDQQLQELLALHGGATGVAPTGGQPGTESPAPTPAAGKTAASSSGHDAPPPGYVPSEPGTHPPSPPEAAAGGAPSPSVSPPPAAPVSPAPGSGPGPASQSEPVHGPKGDKTGASAAASASGSPVAADETPHDTTAAVVASLSKPLEGAPSSPPAAASPASRTEQARSLTVQGAGSPRAEAQSAAKPAADPVTIAGALRAAPLAPQDEVQVLEVVTQIATIVRDLRAQDAQLRADFGKATAENAARLADFERRLALSEARYAVAAARAAGDSGAPISPASADTDPVPPNAPAKTAPVLVRTAAALPPASAGSSDQAAAKRYRVQAASPGLALLAEVERGGGDGAQLEVLVGDKIPGYGKVTSIGQRGTAWVVTTEHGTIQ